MAIEQLPFVQVQTAEAALCSTWPTTANRNRVKLCAMFTLQKSIVCLWLCVYGLSAAAVVPADLYSAETVVADEGSETRNTALSQLLGSVMARVSGNVGVAGQPAAKQMLAAAPSLVQQYRYRSADKDGGMVRYLWARFDQPVVERMMRERNLPVWTQRPGVLLWLVGEQAGARTLLNLENEPAARAAVTAQAQQRGMPLQLPLMDLEDQGKLTAADLWSDYRAAIALASERYPHDVVLSGRLRALGGGRWSGQWSLIDREDSQGFKTPAKSLEETMVSAIDQAQDLLAARYAPMLAAGDQYGTLVRVAGVYDLAAYGRLVALLESLDAVAGVALRHVKGDAFTFDLQLRAGQANLVRGINGSGLLSAEPAPLRPQPPVPVAGPDGGASATVPVLPEVDLYYRLRN